MLNRQTVLRTAFAAALFTIGLAGCGQMRPSQKIQIFEATLSPSQEVPPVVSTATGAAELQFNENTNKLTWKVTYNGLSSATTGAHIHGPTPMGQNAGVVIPFTGNLNAQPIAGETTLTPAQFADLSAGLYYVNIHSARFPAGEIRGQLRRR